MDDISNLAMILKAAENMAQDEQAGETVTPSIATRTVTDEHNHDGILDEETIIDEDETASEEGARSIDTLCEAVEDCCLQCQDHRKIVSHIFGRNKTATLGLPESSWICWCRKHYQRVRYRAVEMGHWHIQQLILTRQQLERFQSVAVVKSWTISLRKAEAIAIKKEDTGAVTDINTGRKGCWERFLIRHLGAEKSFADVRATLDTIAEEFCTPAFERRENKSKDFPGVEFLPTFFKSRSGTYCQPSHIPRIPHKRKYSASEGAHGARTRKSPTLRKRIHLVDDTDGGQTSVEVDEGERTIRFTAINT